MPKKYTSSTCPDAITPSVGEPCAAALLVPLASTTAAVLRSARKPDASASEYKAALRPPANETTQAQLHVRVIALENLLIALLASASDHQLDCAREMAAYILPRAGATPHPLTLHASADMASLIERAMHFRGTPPK